MTCMNYCYPYPDISYTYYEARTGDYNGGTGNLTSGSLDLLGAPSDDFRIGYNSVSKNAGNAIGAPTVDFNEVSRSDGSIDMGCYEYVCGSPSGGTAGTSATVCKLVTSNLTVSGHTAQAIKWQQSSDNSTWTDVNWDQVIHLIVLLLLDLNLLCIIVLQQVVMDQLFQHIQM